MALRRADTELIVTTTHNVQRLKTELLHIDLTCTAMLKKYISVLLYDAKSEHGRATIPT